MSKVIDITIAEKIARDTGIEFSRVLNVIKQYNKEIQLELLEGNTIDTDIGKYKLTARKVNNNFGGSGIAPKVTIKINEEFYGRALNKFIDKM